MERHPTPCPAPPGAGSRKNYFLFYVASFAGNIKQFHFFLPTLWEGPGVGLCIWAGSTPEVG